MLLFFSSSIHDKKRIKMKRNRDMSSHSELVRNRLTFLRMCVYVELCMILSNLISRYGLVCIIINSFKNPKKTKNWSKIMKY